MEVANTILAQLGGNKFLVMTGANHLMADKNALYMNLPRNRSKANRLKITLTPMDTYDVEFTRYSAGRLNRRLCTWVDEKIVTVKKFKGIYADQLQQIFTDVTGMDTHL